jgi:GT2 family glycosyltransferase
MNDSTPLIWIIVLHWCGIENTKACLHSLKQVDYSNHRILLVDNGSKENDSETLRNQFEDISVLRLDKNYGYTGGNNQGMEYCIEKNAEFVWILNNDTTIYPDTLDKLIAAALSDAAAGAIGGPAAVRNTEAGDFVKIGQGIIDYSRVTTPLIEPASNDIIDCDWLSGCNLVLRVSALNKVGKLDDNYFLYFEDADLCMRLRNNGWKCLLVPSAYIEHIGGASSSKNKYAQFYYYARNRLYFFSTYTKGMRRVFCIVVIVSKYMRHTLSFHYFRMNKKVRYKAESYAIRDFIFRRRGKVYYKWFGMLD